MAAFIAFAVVAAVALLVWRLEPGTPAGDAPDSDGSGPRPLPVLGARTVPRGWVRVRQDLRGAEAAVAQSLLESNGVRAALESSAGRIADVATVRPLGVGRYGLWVREVDAAAAEDLLPRHERKGVRR